MSKIIDAVNIVLASVGEEQVADLTEPQALMAKSTLEFVLTELPYDSTDFDLDYEGIPNEVYNFCVVRGVRKFQASKVGSEILHQFSLEDENNAKRLLIRKKMIPKAISEEVNAEVEAILPYSAEEVPQGLKDNLGLLKLQGILFKNPEEYVVSTATVEQEMLQYKRSLVLNRQIPSGVLERVRSDYYSRYGFTGAIPVDLEGTNIATQLLKVMSAWELQKTLLLPEQYVISQEEKNQDEIDFRMALVANKLYPADLYDNVATEFMSAYGYMADELTLVMKNYITFQTMWRLQTILIPQASDRPYTLEDLDNAEANLIANLIVPMGIYTRVLEEVKMELSIEAGVDIQNIPEAVITYAKYRSAYLNQPTAIRNPAKYIISKETLLRAKANASHSLPAITMMSSSAITRIVNNDELPEVTAGSPTTTYRLSV